jgi:hypothetical protein
VKVGNGATVRIAEETRYPFADSTQFTVNAEQAVTFPFYLRVPAWCKAPQVTINGQAAPITAATGKFIRIAREWKNGDVVTLKLPMQVSVRTWTANHNSVSVDYGPLTFSLKIGERYDRHDSTKTAIGDSNWQKGTDPSKWPSWEIHPTTPWNYGLVLDAAQPESSFTVKAGNWPADDFPFTTATAPITITAKARRIPEWAVDRHGLCAVLQNSPVFSEQPEETVTLIPMGAARLRIAAFPVIGAGPGAARWTPPAVPKPSAYKVTASHCYSGDSVEAMGDGLEPASSSDESIPRHTWWTHRGSTEWVQYDFPQPKEISSVEVYWFDDSGKGECRVPKGWRLLYLDDLQWKPVPNAISAGVARDQWNRMRFQPVKTTALRLEAELQPQYSGGILEWRVK